MVIVLVALVVAALAVSSGDILEAGISTTKGTADKVPEAPDSAGQRQQTPDKSGDATTGTSWNLDKVSVKFNCDKASCHADVSTASDPKATVKTAVGSASTSANWDCVPQCTWKEGLFSNRPVEEYLQMNVNIVDYDHSSGNEDFAKCTVSFSESQFKGEEAVLEQNPDCDAIDKINIRFRKQ